MQTLCSKIKVFPHLIKESDLVVLTQLVHGYWIKVKCGAQCLNSQLGCGLSCTVLNLLSEMSHLIGWHSTAKGMGLAQCAI